MRNTLMLWGMTREGQRRRAGRMKPPGGGLENSGVEELVDHILQALIDLAGEGLHRFALLEVLLDDLVSVGFLHAGIPDLVRIHDDIRAVMAATEAHVGAHLDVLDAIVLDPGLEALHHWSRPP